MSRRIQNFIYTCNNLSRVKPNDENPPVDFITFQGVGYITSGNYLTGLHSECQDIIEFFYSYLQYESCVKLNTVVKPKSNPEKLT